MLIPQSRVLPLQGPGHRLEGRGLAPSLPKACSPRPALPYLGPAESAPPCCTCPWLPTTGQAAPRAGRGERKGRQEGGKGWEAEGRPAGALASPPSPGSRGSSSRPPLSQQDQQSQSSADQQVGPAHLQSLSPQAGPRGATGLPPVPARPTLGPPRPTPQPPPCCTGPTSLHLPGPSWTPPRHIPHDRLRRSHCSLQPDKGDISSEPQPLCSSPPRALACPATAGPSKRQI